MRQYGVKVRLKLNLLLLILCSKILKLLFQILKTFERDLFLLLQHVTTFL